ncbi:MAG: hypothetical protein LQ340_007142 [Diploschistes diacapsis]|nr:MAG: hypothetical protein LQ340_007142 [Diploschistes diacapsis]
MLTSLAAIAAFASLFDPSIAAVISISTTSAPVNGSSLVSAYTIPLNNGTASLPSPNNTLSVITAGRGTQNYTCATSTSSSIPVFIGATATLFNLQDLLPILSPLEGQAILSALPPLLLSLPREALQGSIIPQAGEHFFDASGTPTFDLSASGNGMLVSAKLADIAAPEANSTKGPQGQGAVDWLTLSAKEGSWGLSAVYRTETASGQAPATCDGMHTSFTVEYCALYYFLSD